MIGELVLDIDRCPVRYMDSESFFYLEMHAHYKQGFLPEEGGWLTQCMKWLDGIQFIENIRQRMQTEQLKEKERD